MIVDLDNMRERLEAKLAELQTHLNALHEGYRGSESFIETHEKALEFEEAASDLAEQQLQQTIIANEVTLLTEVQAALNRIAQGHYGFCTVCGEPIPEKRLEALPWAARCAKDEEQFELKQHIGT
jgi:RNA polymerase-binding transcription factor